MSFRTRRAFCAGLLLLAGPAAAQGPPPTPPASLTPAAPAAAIDPQVTALFKQTVAAHQALPALTAAITISSVGMGPSVTQTVTLAYQKPKLAKIAVSAADGPIVQFFSDGKTITIYLIKEKTYQTQPVQAGTDPVPAVLDQAHALLPRLLGRPEMLNELLLQPGVSTKIALEKRGDAATPVDTVIAILPTADGHKEIFTFDIGKTDHLLRQLTEQASEVSKGKLQTVTLTETVTTLSTVPTLTAADFAFTPPPGVSKIVPPKAGQSDPPMHDPRLLPGAAPFAVAAKDLSGKPLSLAQYKGKVVLMDFWATWCGPCVGEMPNVIAAYKKYHAQGFDVVGISLDKSRPALTSFIAENKMPWRQVFDGGYWNSAVPKEYGVQSIPFGLLIGRDGKIAAVDVRGTALTAAIQQALRK